MKKIFTLVIICFALLLLLTACGNKAEQNTSPEFTAEEQPMPVAAVTEAASPEENEEEDEEIIVDYVEDYVVEIGENEEFVIH